MQRIVIDVNWPACNRWLKCSCRGATAATDSDWVQVGKEQDSDSTAIHQRHTFQRLIHVESLTLLA